MAVRKRKTKRGKPTRITIRLNPKQRRKPMARKRKSGSKRKRTVSMATRSKLRRAALKRGRSKRQAGARHKLTVYKRQGRWYRSRKSRLVGRKTRINPRRRRRTRRNPVRAAQFVNKRLIMQAVTFLAGFGGGLYFKKIASGFPLMNQIPPKYQGFVTLLLGGFMATSMRDKKIKAIGAGVFAAGLYDLVSGFVALPFTASVAGLNYRPGGSAQVIGAGINNYSSPMVIDTSGDGEADFADSIESFG